MSVSKLMSPFGTSLPHCNHIYTTASWRSALRSLITSPIFLQKPICFIAFSVLVYHNCLSPVARSWWVTWDSRMLVVLEINRRKLYVEDSRRVLGGHECWECKGGRVLRLPFCSWLGSRRPDRGAMTSHAPPCVSSTSHSRLVPTQYWKIFRWLFFMIPRSRNAAPLCPWKASRKLEEAFWMEMLSYGKPLWPWDTPMNRKQLYCLPSWSVSQTTRLTTNQGAGDL